MSEDITANALALEIFRDNLRLHTEIEGLLMNWNLLKETVMEDGVEGVARWNRYFNAVYHKRFLSGLEEMPTAKRVML